MGTAHATQTKTKCIDPNGHALRKARKFCRPSLFEGVVNGRAMRAEGRTKREATKRLRTMFALSGMPTLVRTEPSGDGSGPAYVERLSVRGPLSNAELSMDEKSSLRRHLNTEELAHVLLSHKAA